VVEYQFHETNQTHGPYSDEEHRCKPKACTDVSRRMAPGAGIACGRPSRRRALKKRAPPQNEGSRYVSDPGHSPAVSRRVLLGMLGAAVAAPARAQAYPSRAIRIVIPFAPGGVPDIVARLIAPKLTETLGQAVVVENRPGAGGTVAATHIAKSEPDGYALFLTTVSTQAISPHILDDLQYDPRKDFAPISHIANVPLVLLINPGLPAKTTAEFIELLRKNPGKYDFASSGAGAPLHLAAELFRVMTNTQSQHIPYKGSGPALADLIAGRVAFLFDALPPSMPHIQAGTVRALGVGTKQRAHIMPALPTLDESGLPSFEAYTWAALFAPARTPRAVIEQLSQTTNAAIRAQEVQKRLAELGYETVASTPEDLQRHVTAEFEKWGELIRRTGIKGTL
jgi:tripartite-type tricarboxylate transporter receptor subunit TctC